MKDDPAAFAVVMAFEAFRICIGQRTKTPPEEVMRWMREMLKAKTHGHRVSPSMRVGKP